MPTAPASPLVAVDANSDSQLVAESALLGAKLLLSSDEHYRGSQKMKESARYPKIVEWSDEDQCFVGSSPGLFYAGCHGTNEKQVFEGLCQMVQETIELFHQDGKPLPPATSGRDLANRLAEIA